MTLSIEQAKEQIQYLHGKPLFQKMLSFASILHQLTEPYGIHPIIVGGFAVELYTQNAYLTSDLDLVFARRDIADQIFRDLGFLKQGKSWYHTTLELSVEIPGDMLEDADIQKVTKLNIANGQVVYVIGIEDILLDRLRACVHWKSTDDCEWAYRLFQTHKERLDIGYLLQACKRDGTEPILQTWLKNS